MANPSNSTVANDVFDVRRIRRLVELMHENDLAEIDLQQGELRIQLRRSVSNVLVPQQFASPMPVQTPTIPATSVPNVPAVPEDTKKYDYIKSPMVGTFYAASNPEAAPFVKPGDSVTPERTVCLIEAMKVFNEIPAEISGKIVEVLVKNGEAVEFGKPLFKIDPNG